MAYEDPQNSLLSYLLSSKHREVLSSDTSATHYCCIHQMSCSQYTQILNTCVCVSQVIADIINVVLVSEASARQGSGPNKCILEQLLAQLCTVHDTFIECNEDLGEKFSLKPFLQTNYRV